MSDLWNVIHKEEKAMLEHTIWLHTCKSIYLNLSLVTCIFYVLSPCTVYIMLSILFSFTWKWRHGVIETLCKTSFAYFYYESVIGKIILTLDRTENLRNPGTSWKLVKNFQLKYPSGKCASNLHLSWNYDITIGHCCFLFTQTGFSMYIANNLCVCWCST